MTSLLLVAGVSAHAQTQTFTWSGYTGAGYTGNWSDTTNWVGASVPVSSTTTSLYLVNTSANRVLNQNISSTFQASTIIISSPVAASLTVNGGTFEIYGPTGATLSSVLISSGTGGSATLSTQVINSNLSLKTTGTIQANYASLTLGGNIDLGGNSVNFTSNSYTGTGSNPTALRLNGIISDSSASTSNKIYFAGPGSATPVGSMYVMGNNTYTGGTAVQNMTVYVGHQNAFGASTADVEVGAAGGGTTNPSILTSGAINMSRNFRVMTAAAGNATKATLGGSTADSSTFSGNIILNRTGSAGTMTAQALIVTATNSGRVDFSGNIMREAAAAATASDTLTKTGTGIVALNGSANNYLGTTSVSQGVLLVDGTLTSGGGAVSVGAGATLGGIGTINRAVSIADSGVLSAGEMNASLISQAGTLTLGGDLALSAASQLNFNLGTAKDLISIGGNLTLDGVLNVSQDAGFGVGTYRLLNYTGTLTDNGLAVSLAGYTGVIDTSVANQVNLIVSIPEPSTTALMLGGLLIVLGQGMRRRKTAGQI